MRFLSSVHLRVEEKISLTCGRDGGLQNMEVLGMVTLRVTDDKNGRIRLIINNNDNKGLQLQVRPPHIMNSSWRECCATQQYISWLCYGKKCFLLEDAGCVMLSNLCQFGFWKYGWAIIQYYHSAILHISVW